jgi:hypothetical protein
MIDIGRVRGWAVLALLLGLPGLTSSIASASVMFGSATGFGNPPIYTINQDTGTATTLGPSGVDSLSNMTSDWRPATYRLWAVKYLSPAQLVRVNPTTGACTVVAAFSSTISEIAFDVVTGQMYGTGLSPSTLYRIDPDTGAAVKIGETGRANLEFIGLGFDLQGNLFGVDNSNHTLYRINTATGATTAIGPTGTPSGVVIGDLAARPEDGVMFGVTSAGSNNVYRVNTTTGAATLVGPANVSGSINGLAFSPIPEPTAAALLAAPVITMLGRRRRRR